MELYLGEMCGSIHDFWEMSLGELLIAINGYRRAQEDNIRRQYEMMRTMGMWMLQPHSRKALRVQDVMSLPWDREVPSVHVTDEIREAARRRIMERDAKPIIKKEESRWLH